MKKVLITLGFVLILLGAISCGFPSENQVKQEFRDANPTLSPLSAIVGEGHGDAAYYHIRYKKQGDNRIYEQVWLYLRQNDNTFKVTHKEKETIVD